MKVRIREIMKERGMTSVMLADEMGITSATLNVSLSRGVTGMVKISQIANALGVPVWEMFKEPEIKCAERVTGQSTEHRIMDLLKDKSISQLDLSNRIGKDPGTVSRCINNPNTTVQSLEAIANALEVPVWQLFISEEDYRREMERRRGVTPVDNGEGIMDNKAPRDAATSEGMTTMATSAANQGKVFPEDLFAGAEEQEWPALEDGTYRYGGVVIELRNGKINIAIPEK